VGTEKRERQKAGRQSRRAEAEVAARKARNRGAFIKWGLFALVILAIIVGFTVFSGDDDNGGDAETAATTTSAAPTTTLPPTPCPPADGSATQTLEFSAPFEMCIDPAKTYTAVFHTSEGDIRVALDTDKTPQTANNFVALSRYKYYDGTTIFRTDPSIDIIQGGAPHTNSASDPGPGYTIPDEGSGFTYSPGQLVMARTAAPNSAGAQFFFVAGDKASALDSQGTYVVFGQADDAGLGVIQSILGLHQDNPDSDLGGAPSRTVTIESVTIEEA
jgi:cyclophilin family peptidyl-prolyl cis-trans isomerase